MLEAATEAGNSVISTLSGEDNTDYDYIRTAVRDETDGVVEGRLDGASLEDKTLHTN